MSRCCTQPPHRGDEFLRERSRQYTTDAASGDTTDTNTRDTTEPKMTFEEYRKLKKSLKMRRRVAGIPMGLGAVVLSSAISVQLNPRMFEMTPEEIQPIL